MEIILSRGLVALVDDEDFERVNQYNWFALKAVKKYYAVRNENKSTTIMHRFILNADKGIYVDHINGDSLDNRKFNLRTCTNQQNSRNSKKQNNCSSKYKGVCWIKQRNKFLAQICINYKQVFLGYYDDEIEAAKSYDEAARKGFSDFAALNFPTVGELSCLDKMTYDKDKCLILNENRKFKNCTSKNKGIYKHKQNNKWITSLYDKAKKIYIGSFSTEEEAVEARNEYLKTI